MRGLTKDIGTTKAVGALLGLSLSTFIYVTAEMLPIGLLLVISRDLNVSPSAVGMLVTGYGLVVVVASVPLTLLTRRVPRRSLVSGVLVTFVVANSLSAAASSYWILMGARLVIALSQALFWSVVVSTASSLFSPYIRGRVIAVVFTGGSLAAVLGIPLGTWLGQQLGWRIAFLALTGFGVAAAGAVATLLPGGPPEDSPATHGTTPSVRRYSVLLIVTILATTGAFTTFTYITSFLTGLGTFTSEAIGPLLLARGVAGILGVAVGGVLVDTRPWLAAVVPLVLQAVALLGLYGFGNAPVVTIGLVALTGLSFAALNAALASLVLHVAPGRADVAGSGAATATNVGITVGAFIGGALLPGPGVRSTALVGGLFSLAALVAAFCGLRPLSPVHRRWALTVFGWLG